MWLCVCVNANISKPSVPKPQQLACRFIETKGMALELEALKLHWWPVRLCYIWTIINLHSHQENSHCCIVMRQILFHIKRQNVLESSLMHQIIKHPGFLPWLIRYNYSLASEMPNTHTVIDLDQHCEIQCFWKIKSFVCLAEDTQNSFKLTNILLCVHSSWKLRNIYLLVFSPYQSFTGMNWTALWCSAIPSASACTWSRNGMVSCSSGTTHWKDNVVFIA